MVEDMHSYYNLNDQNDQLLRREHVRHLDQWESNIWEIHDNSIVSSKQEDELFNDSIEHAYNMATSEETRGNEVYFLTGDLQLDRHISNEMLKMSLGKKVGRTRKKNLFRNVFEVKGFKKLKSRYNKKKMGLNRSVGKRKVGSLERQELVELHTKSVGEKLLESKKDLAEQILESADLMGLVPQENREQAVEKI